MNILPNNIAILENDLWISKWVRESGRLDHDQWLLPRVLPYIPEGGCVIDIGAFIGDHTIAYANKVGMYGDVLAFEVNPAPFACLVYNMKRFPWVKCINEGMSDEEGVAAMFTPGQNSGATYLILKDKENLEPVELKPLDNYGGLAPNFIKIDAEGYEVKILKGAKNTIAVNKPIMLIEVNSGALERAGTSTGELFYLLKDYGYTFENIDGTGNLTGPQYDILCKPVKN